MTFEGQMTLFEYEENLNYKEPPMLLKKGQVVFMIQKGDVERGQILEENWLCGDRKCDRGYRVLKESGSYDVVSNSKIGQDVFVEEGAAKTISEKFLAEHTVIRAENIIVREVVAYSYIRDVDNRKMTAFYCDIGNELLYMKDFMTFHHIMRNCNKTIKEFMKEIDEMKGLGVDVERIEYQPNPKNMYLCRGGNWLYTEAGCTYGVG